ncbi:MAG: PEP-CTERM sorting domain-containing protein [Verrucomicrobiota bacterium]
MTLTPFFRPLHCAIVLLFVFLGAAFGQTLPSSPNGNPWSFDSFGGGVNDMGSGTFNGFGLIQIQRSGSPGFNNFETSDYQFANDGPNRIVSTVPQVFDGITISRQIDAIQGGKWLRFYDTFTNSDVSSAVLEIMWGGRFTSDDGMLTVEDTSSGDSTLDAADSWMVVHPGSDGNAFANRFLGPVGLVFGNEQFDGAVSYGDFGLPWQGEDQLGLVQGQFPQNILSFGDTFATVHYLYQGQSTDPNSANPSSLTYEQEVALAIAETQAMAANPDFSGLTEDQANLVINISPTPIPEPASAALLLAAAGLLALRRRK